MMNQPRPSRKSDDAVLLFPTLASRGVNSSTWDLKVSGAIYNPNEVKTRTKVLLRLLSRAMRIQPHKLESPIFKERIRPFVGTAKKGKSLSVSIGDSKFPIKKKSRGSGLFSVALEVPHQQILPLIEQNGEQEFFPFQVHVGSGTQEATKGMAYLVQPHGLSVISDIDDTIKETHVSVRSKLIENTFFREFSPIDGMASVYREWGKMGANFHYVSSSPWQLCDPLLQLLNAVQFPGGSFHLRQARWREQVLRSMMLMRRRGKARVIQGLLELFPERKFILVGDSREKDPEMYMRIVRKFRHQVLATFIRSYEDRPLSGERLDRIHRKFRPTNIFAFHHADELRAQSQSILAHALSQPV